MKNMKRILFLAAFAALFLSAGLAGRAGGPRTGVKAPADTLVINTTELCKDVIGYDGPTPLVIKVVGGVVASVEALPNTESPSYFERVIKGAAPSTSSPRCCSGRGGDYLLSSRERR